MLTEMHPTVHERLPVCAETDCLCQRAHTAMELAMALTCFGLREAFLLQMLAREATYA
jgi:hypothetical protein